jgi:hypothetical protein
MKVEKILAQKGTVVYSIRPNDCIHRRCKALRLHDNPVLVFSQGFA